MNKRQRSKRRVQRQIRARMGKLALAVEFSRSLPPAFCEPYASARWLLSHLSKCATADINELRAMRRANTDRALRAFEDERG